MNSIPVSESQFFIGLDSLIARAVKHLASLGYRQGTIGNYQYIWKEFTPYIFSYQQVENIFQAVDSTLSDSRSPMRHLIMPEIFRLLYCCGMRVSEVLHLKFSDVNLDAGHGDNGGSP